MSLLNILQHNDGSFAWENVLVILVAIIAGYLFKSYGTKKKQDEKAASAIAGWETKYKRLENEYKNYKSGIVSGEKHNEKAIAELNGRVKSLEGDIRVLSEEKNKLNHLIADKGNEIKMYSKQLGDADDRFKSLQEQKIKAESDLAARLKDANANLLKASAWEHRVKGAEEEAQKAKNAIANAERKKLEAELRLKATADYAGKVAPLEKELIEWKEKYATLDDQLKNKMASDGEAELKIKDWQDRLSVSITEINGLKSELAFKEKSIGQLEQQLRTAEDTASKLTAASAHLELLKQSSTTMQQELASKDQSLIALRAEIETLKNHSNASAPLSDPAPVLKASDDTGSESGRPAVE